MLPSRLRVLPILRFPDGGAGDAVARAGGDAPLLRRALDILGGVVGLVHVGLERVGREVVVRGADVGVAQPFAHPPQGAVVIAGQIRVVDDDRHAELLGQIEEVLLLVSHHHGDIGDARLVAGRL